MNRFSPLFVSLLLVFTTYSVGCSEESESDVIETGSESSEPMEGGETPPETERITEPCVAISGETDLYCDGIDDDCDGQIDEDFVGEPTTCGQGPCETEGTTTCVDGVLVDSCIANTPNKEDDTCDGIDDDCDGETDEDFVGAVTTCGSGDCTGVGEEICENGTVVDSCAAPESPALADDTCDGIDDDCDGTVDEDAVSTAISCGVGACIAEGSQACVDGQWVNDCEPGAAGAADTTCNGVDDDCDGEFDEDFAEEVTSCGNEACPGAGVLTCSEGSLVDSCAPPEVLQEDTTCDGIDDDCDGEIDEDFLGLPTACGKGACKVVAAPTCTDGVESLECIALEPSVDVDTTCDGIDDDCDGDIDEDVAGFETVCGTGPCATAGIAACENGVFVDSCTPLPILSAVDKCDGVDDDCDGELDEDFIPEVVTCGQGACIGSGASFCLNGAIVDNCTAGTEAEDDTTCDGVDDDCDGDIDEDFVPDVTDCGDGACSATGLSSCVDGELFDSCAPDLGQEVCDDENIDEDCDGLPDDADPDATGQTLWYPDLDGDNFGDSLAEPIASCDPIPSTVPDNTDCDDDNQAVNPLAVEICADELDNDCDGLTDDEDDCSELVAEGFITGGTDTTWSTSNYFRGNVYTFEQGGILEAFSVYYGPSAGCLLDLYVHPVVNGVTQPHVFHTAVTASGGTQYYSSGPVNLEIQPGESYGIGGAWNCSSQYLGSTVGCTDYGPFTFLKSYWDNSYSGYSTSYAPPNFGSDCSVTYQQEILYAY